MKTLTIYLAGRMSGVSIEKTISWRRYFATLLEEEKGITISLLDPTKDMEFQGNTKTVLTPQSFTEIPVQSAAAIFERDIAMVRQCDIIVCHMIEDDWKSIGTCFELGYGYALNKSIIVVTDEGSYAHQHPFIDRAAVKLATLEEVVEYIKYAFPYQVGGN